MESLAEIIPFAKEMMNQKPKWAMVKIYTIGSTLAILGVIGGLLGMVLLPFEEQEVIEETPVFLLRKKKEKEQVFTSHTYGSGPEDALETAVIKHLVSAGQRSSANRLHAS
ncbi:G0/G1 switch protein 2 [Cynoglossus semilaevis]|uniref:G0/G1 switch protein 2 n=1 Tax=Cynoglossus semilaevis TaxID=244447 RepID=UPI000496683D|nr:G0/G1 switch protein 2 [Cynoglossus semilaevis]